MEINPGDYLDNLSFALMVNVEIQKGKWMAAYDLFAFDIDANSGFIESITFDVNNPIPGRPPIEVGVDLDAGTNFHFRGRQNTINIGYNLLNERLVINAATGVRWISLRSELDWRLGAEINGPDGWVLERSGYESVSAELWNIVAGLRGKYDLSENRKWSVLYYVDLGAGDTKFTWQSITGFSYNTKRIDYKLAYRHIGYNMKEDRVFDNLFFSGTSFGLTIKL